MFGKGWWYLKLQQYVIVVVFIVGALLTHGEPIDWYAVLLWSLAVIIITFLAVLIGWYLAHLQPCIGAIAGVAIVAGGTFFLVLTPLVEMTLLDIYVWVVVAIASAIEFFMMIHREDQ